MSEIELHRDEIKSKKQTDEKKINLKLIKTNSYKLKSITGLSYVF